MYIMFIFYVCYEIWKNRLLPISSSSENHMDTHFYPNTWIYLSKGIHKWYWFKLDSRACLLSFKPVPLQTKLMRECTNMKMLSHDNLHHTQLNWWYCQLVVHGFTLALHLFSFSPWPASWSHPFIELIYMIKSIQYMHATLVIIYINLFQKSSPTFCSQCLTHNGLLSEWGHYDQALEPGDNLHTSFTRIGIFIS